MSNPPPTLVSTFEILFSPQLPPSIAPSAVVAIDELVVKGYFLTIANPNPTAYIFTVGFHCNPVSPQTNANSLAGAVGFLDNGTPGATLSISPTTPATSYAASVSVAANGAALIGILPAFFNNSGLTTPDIDVRGWVDITLPALFKKFEAGSTPQASAPVQIIVTPEQRLTFLPMAGDAPTTVESQAAFALPLAGGSALLSVPPQPGGFIFHNP